MKDKFPYSQVLLILWIVITLAFAWEYTVINSRSLAPSILRWCHENGIFFDPSKRINLEAGSPFSYALGWIGFCTLLLTNLYIIRKRHPKMRNMGKQKNWLEVHIFFGLLGTTFIVFHTNFKVGGLVAISFWSMMISFVSGVIGRYFYLQLLTERQSLKETVDQYDAGFDKLIKAGKIPSQNDEFSKVKRRMVVYSGGYVSRKLAPAHAGVMIMNSIAGDLRLLLLSPPIPRGLRFIKAPLTRYAVAKRRMQNADSFRKLMGYWHTFHLPFAIFMYAVSIIHIITALIFRVEH